MFSATNSELQVTFETIIILQLLTDKMNLKQ